jgi:hypothetical protein
MLAVKLSPIRRSPIQCLQEILDRDGVVEKACAFGQEWLEVLRFGDEQNPRCGCVFAEYAAGERDEESDKNCCG